MASALVLAFTTVALARKSAIYSYGMAMSRFSLSPFQSLCGRARQWFAPSRGPNLINFFKAILTLSLGGSGNPHDLLPDSRTRIIYITLRNSLFGGRLLQKLLRSNLKV